MAEVNRVEGATEDRQPLAHGGDYSRGLNADRQDTLRPVIYEQLSGCGDSASRF
jgi:hypothetical protein